MTEQDRRDQPPPEEETVVQIARADKEDIDEKSRNTMGGNRHDHTAEPLESEAERGRGAGGNNPGSG